MKKNLTIILAAALACACTKEEPAINLSEYGYIDLGVATEEVTKASSPVSAGDLASWTVTVTEDGEPTPAFTGPANTLSSKAFPAGEYSVSAYNYIDDATACTQNLNWGAARYAGSTSGNVNVTAGQSAQASIDCGKAQNARFSVQFEGSFLSIAEEDSYSLSTTDARSLTFNSANVGAKAYYAKNASVPYTLSYKFGEDTKTVSGTLTLGNAGTEKVIKIKGNSNGTISISISVDSEFVSDGSQDITIDAVSGEKE